MPELPDLEIIREYLAPRLPGVGITSAVVRRLIIVRNLLGDDFAAYMTGRCFADVRRRGKFLLLGLDDGAALVINPMLAGRLRYGEPLKRDRVRDALALRLADGHELRYHDAEDMGKIYLTLDLAQVPTFADVGPEANDPSLTLDVFLRIYSAVIARSGSTPSQPRRKATATKQSPRTGTRDCFAVICRTGWRLVNPLAMTQAEQIPSSSDCAGILARSRAS